MRRFDEEALRGLAWATDEEPIAWLLDAEASVDFLRDNAKRDELVIYASGGAVLMHGVLAPAAQVTPADHKDLSGAYLTPEDAWCIQRAWGGRPRASHIS